MTEAKGIWIDGRISKQEMAGLQQLLKTACEKFANRELPWKFQNEKITFEAVAKDNDLHIFYGWNFPPAAFHSKEIKDYHECEKCDPDSITPAREVWCEKKNYHFPICPYGYPTPKRVVQGVAS